MHSLSIFFFFSSKVTNVASNAIDVAAICASGVAAHRRHAYTHTQTQCEIVYYSDQRDGFLCNFPNSFRTKASIAFQP